MTWRHVLVVLAAAVLPGCAQPIEGTATWPGARLEKAVLTAADFPQGVQYDRITRESGQADGAGAPPAMLSRPEGCSDGLTRVIADSAERGPGSAAEYVVAYDGARMVITVLTWPLDLDRLAAVADRCAEFETFFDPSTPGIPMTTTRLQTPRADALVYEQTMRLSTTETASTSHSRTWATWRCSGSRSRHPIRRSPSKVRCRRRFWISPPSRPTARVGLTSASAPARKTARSQVSACSVAKCRRPWSPSTVSACPSTSQVPTRGRSSWCLAPPIRPRRV